VFLYLLLQTFYKRLREQILGMAEEVEITEKTNTGGSTDTNQMSSPLCIYARVMV
jgi:hypothetical protein